MSRAAIHSWKDYQQRFAVGREWTTIPEVHKTWVAESKAAGKPYPTLNQLAKKASGDKWIEKRKKNEDREQARAATLVINQRARVAADRIKLLDSMSSGGNMLYNMGSGYFKAVKEYEDFIKNLKPKKGEVVPAGPRGVENPYEAMAAMRIGAQLAKLSSDAQMKLVAPEAPVDPDDDEGDGQVSGIIIVPPQQSAEEWAKGRRKNLGKDGGDK